MKRVLPLVLILFVVVTVSACNLTQRRAVTESYKISDQLLESTRKSMRTLCDNGVFPPEKCEELRVKWERARDEFVKAGDALIAANKAGNTVDSILNGIKAEIRRIEQ
jgi:hypothetical protein